MDNEQINISIELFYAILEMIMASLILFFTARNEFFKNKK